VGNAYCYKEAGKDFDIDPLLLLAISIRESRLSLNAVNLNKNKQGIVTSKDFGIMQVNSENLSRLGLTPEIALTNPCLNVYAGANVLRRHFNLWGENWRAVGSYNAGFAMTDRQERRRMTYARDIHIIYKELLNLQREGRLSLDRQ